MSDLLTTQSIGVFLDQLASQSPTPGGGSVAALSGAMAAGLVGMVCSLMSGKKQFAAIQADIAAIQARAEILRRDLQQFAQDDISVFDRLAAAYRLPKTSEAEQANRHAAIQQATRLAAEVPLRVARAAAAVVPLCTALVNRCGRNIVSDIGVAAILARATVQSAMLNIEINLASLEDQVYVHEVQNQIEELAIGLNEEIEGIVEITRQRIHQGAA